MRDAGKHSQLCRTQNVAVTSLLPASCILLGSRRYSFGDIGLAISNNTRRVGANYSQIQGSFAAWLACRF
jgi:hypothetical protein